jgi:hypothetical protein
MDVDEVLLAIKTHLGTVEQAAAFLLVDALDFHVTFGRSMLDADETTRAYYAVFDMLDTDMSGRLDVKEVQEMLDAVRAHGGTPQGSGSFAGHTLRAGSRVRFGEFASFAFMFRAHQLVAPSPPSVPKLPPSKLPHRPLHSRPALLPRRPRRVGWRFEQGCGCLLIVGYRPGGTSADSCVLLL